MDFHIADQIQVRRITLYSSPPPLFGYRGGEQPTPTDTNEIQTMNDTGKPQRCIFISERIAAPKGVKLAYNVRKGKAETHTWSTQQWINELTRVPENSHHIIEKKAHVYLRSTS